MSRPRRLTAVLVTALSACGTPEPPAPPTVPGVAPGTARAELTADAAGPRLVVRVRTPSGGETTVAELVGAWLDTGDGGRWLDVADWTTGPDRIVARCTGPADHEIRITVRNLEGPRLRVTLEDRIGVRVSLAALGVAWRMIDGGAPDEVAVPLIHPDADGLAGDAAFRSPIAFVRAGTRSLAVLPDLDAAARWRRIPQALRVDPTEDGARILHAYAAQRIDVSLHSARVRRDAGAGIRVRDEVIRLEHVLHVAADARRGETLAALRTAVWRDRMAPAFRRSAAPFVDESWARLVPAAVRARLDADLRTEPRGGDPVAFLVDPDASTPDVAVARLGARRNQLRDALAALRLGVRTDDEELRRTALQLARFALVAPRRGGLTPHSYRLRVADRRVDWLPGDPDGPRPDAFDAADSATTAVLLLELGDVLEELRPAVLGTAADLARFLIASQRDDGAIPGVYDRRYLTTVALEEDALAGATAGPAWFLARYALASGDPDVLDAARRAVRFVTDRIRLDDGPLADPSLFRPHLRDPGSGATVHDLGPLTLATRAAVALAERDPSFADAAEGCVDALVGLQQVWTPPWTGTRLAGGFGGSNADATWNAAGQADAAQAMFDAFRLLGREELLERGTAALRTALVEPSPFLPDGSVRPNPRPLASAAAGVAERCRLRLGQAVLDLEQDLAHGIDAVWFEDLDRAADRVRFRTLTHAPDVGPIEVTLRSSARVMPRLVHASVEVQPSSPGRVTVDPRLVPALTFRPPAIVPAPGEWWPEAAYLGPPPGADSVHVEVFDQGQLLERIPLRDAGTGRLVAAERPLRIVVQMDGEALQARLVHDEDGRRVTVPPASLIDLGVGPMACIDPGDDLESTLVDSGPGTAVVRFVDGRENAREAAAGGGFTYALPIPRDAAAVELRVLASGALAISSGPEGRALYADLVAVPPGDRSISLRLADPRLWPDGELELRFRPVGSSMSVARIEFLASGTTERAEVGPTRDLTAPDARYDLLVLPVGVSGLRPPDPELVRQALAGGAEYRLTPEPEARPTVGSLARWITDVSGGRTQVAVEILEPSRFDAPAAEMSEPTTWRRLLESAGPELTGALQARPDPFDAILLVHSGVPLPVPADLAIGGTPVVVLPEREPDGSFLSCGRIARGLLMRLSGLAPLGRAENGAFGDLALTAKASGHAPAAPAGINLVRTGWAGIVEIGPQDDGRTVRLPPLLEGRTILRAASGGLPGAGTLILETRRDGGAAGAGLLVYRVFAPGEEPFLRTLDGRTVRTHIWRLSPSVATLRTPFESAKRSDLFRDTFRLDDAGPPSLATPRGETPWTLERLEIVGGTTADLRFRWHGVDVLGTARRGWATGFGAAVGPIPEDGLARGPGRVVASDGGPVLELDDREGGALRGIFEGRTTTAAQRLFVRFEDASGGTADVQVSIPGETLAQARLTTGPCTIVADVPPGGGDRIVLTVTRIDGTPRARLAGLSLVPRAASAAAVALPELPTESVRLMDGTYRGGTRTLRLDERGVARVRVPVLAPATRGVLRVVCGTAHRDPRAAKLWAELRDTVGGEPLVILDGIEVRGHPDHETPLVVALCELPESSDRRLAFLDLHVRGEPGAALHLVTVEIDRL